MEHKHESHEHKHDDHKDHHDHGEHKHHDHKEEPKADKKPSELMQKLTSKAFLMPAAIAAIVIALVLTVFFQGWVVAATVNGGAVSRFKVIKALEANDGEAALSAMIEEKLIEQAIRKAKVSVSQADVDAEIDALKEQFASIGQDFDSIVEQQGLTQDEVNEQVKKQLQLEALLSENAAVTEEEIDEFIAANEIEIPADETEAATLRDTVRDSIKQNKLYAAYDELLANLKSDANITYFVNYAN